MCGAEFDATLEELQAMEPIFHTETFHRQAHLSAGYWEVGASGRVYEREFILKHLAEHPPVDAAEAGWRASGFSLSPLGSRTFLLTYRLDQQGRLSRRATLWRRDDQGWMILYHQGTLIAPDDAAASAVAIQSS